MSVPSSRPHMSSNAPIDRTGPANTGRGRTRNRRRIQRQTTDAPSQSSHASRQAPDTSSSCPDNHLQGRVSSNQPYAVTQNPSNRQESHPSPSNLPSWHAQGLSQLDTASTSGFYGSYNPYAGFPATNPAPYYPLATYGNTNITSDPPDAHSSAIDQFSYYQSANYQSQREAYYSQSYAQSTDPSSFAHHAYLQTGYATSIYSNPYYSQVPNSAANQASYSFHPYLGTFGTAPYNSYSRYRPSLLAQKVFFLDSFGHTTITDEQTKALQQAIPIAHRFVFSQKSLQILYHVLVGRSHYTHRRDLHIGSALDALVQGDGMLVVLDCVTRHCGWVRSEDPSVLRINATLVKQAIRARDIPKYQLHIFYLASVVAHLMCRSIQLTIGGPRTQDICGWETQFFGGMIERVSAIPGLWGAVEGEIEHLRVVFQDSGGVASVIIPGDTIMTLIEGHPGWQWLLPLKRNSDDILRGRHDRQLPFDAVSVDKEDRPENRTPERQISPWYHDIGDVIEDPRGWERVVGREYAVRLCDRPRLP